MPVKYKRPEWEWQDNRTAIITILLEKSLRFKDLIKETGLARSTLSKHLNELQEQQLIEKAVKDGHLVYQATIDEERLETEFKRVDYDNMYRFISDVFPETALLMKISMKLTVKLMIINRKRRLELKPPLEGGELLSKIVESIERDLTDDEKKTARSEYIQRLLTYFDSDNVIFNLFKEDDQ